MTPTTLDTLPDVDYQHHIEWLTGHDPYTHTTPNRGHNPTFQPTTMPE